MLGVLNLVDVEHVISRTHAGVLNLVDVEHVISRTHAGGIKPCGR